jgi:asparaginyl-tRNA synthetase
MIEPEMSFCNLEENMNHAEKFLKRVVSIALSTRRDDLDFFNQFYDKSLLSRLQSIVDAPFLRVCMHESIDICYLLLLLIFFFLNS